MSRSHDTMSEPLAGTHSAFPSKGPSHSGIGLRQVAGRHGPKLRASLPPGGEAEEGASLFLCGVGTRTPHKPTQAQ